MYELIWFIGGAVIYKFLARVFALTQTAAVFKNIEYNILLLLATVTEDMSYIKSLKYKIMRESNLNPEQIKKNRMVDEEFFEAWKSSCIRNIQTSVPNYIELSFGSWKEGMSMLSSYYRNQRHEKQKEE
tara:strand:+ start:35271 stop:35657 length:387 start_codon:yes stop_codon:yes gene_type:complete